MTLWLAKYLHLTYVTPMLTLLLTLTQAAWGSSASIGCEAAASNLAAFRSGKVPYVSVGRPIEIPTILLDTQSIVQAVNERGPKTSQGPGIAWMTLIEAMGAFGQHQPNTWNSESYPWISKENTDSVQNYVASLVRYANEVILPGEGPLFASRALLRVGPSETKIATSDTDPHPDGFYLTGIHTFGGNPTGAEIDGQLTTLPVHELAYFGGTLREKANGAPALKHWAPRDWRNRVSLVVFMLQVPQIKPLHRAD